MEGGKGSVKGPGVDQTAGVREDTAGKAEKAKGIAGADSQRTRIEKASFAGPQLYGNLLSPVIGEVPAGNFRV